MFCRSLFVLLSFFFCPLCCLPFFSWWFLITPLVSFDHCVVCPSSVYGFWLPLWYLLTIVLSALLQFTVSDNSFGIFWPLCCLSFFSLQILITPLVLDIYRFWLPLWYWIHTDSDYPSGIGYIQILITPLVLDTYGFWLPLWYWIHTDSDYPSGIEYIQILITPLVLDTYGFWLSLWYWIHTDSD